MQAWLPSVQEELPKLVFMNFLKRTVDHGQQHVADDV